jgi:Spy/CpxP family protein refolding chaperone
MSKKLPAILFAILFVATTGIAVQAYQDEGSVPEPFQLAAAPGDDSGPPQFGRPEFKGRHGRRGRGWRGLAERLGLSEEQRDKMREIKVDFKNQTRKTRISLLSLKDEKRTMIMSAKIDQKKLKELDDAIVKAKTELMTARFKMKRERLKLLTPDQLKKLADFVSSKRWGGRGFHGRGKRFGRW